ncbi:MAG TPA: signal peptide peptidase SppA [Azospirillum sp.]|nr:signal peptide peptidase SppA [Azospirillum sp.]
MLKFLVRLFAFLGFLVFAGIVAAIVFAVRREPTLPERIVLELDLDQPLADSPSPGSLSALFGHEATLRDMLDTLERARTDRRVRGLVARVGGHEMGFAQAQDLRAAIERFRATGRFAIAFSEGFGEGGSGNRSYYLASAFDEVWLQPLGMVSLTGLAAEVPFARDALDWLGLQPQVQQREEYKSFAETFTQRDFSPAHREEMEALLADLTQQIVDGVARGRRLDAGAVRALVDQAPLLEQEALQARLVDRIGYRDEAHAEGERRAGGAETVDALEYLDIAGPPNDDGPTVALVTVAGTISRGESGGGGPVGELTAGSDSVVEALNDAIDDDDVRAILLRIDTGGGSVTASEAIRRAVVRAREAGKPVIASMGDMAASGGYWIAMNTDRIVAAPGTITGSIGVIAGKMSAGALSEKLGVRWGVIEEGKNAGMWSLTRPFDEAEMARLSAVADASYAAFLTQVGAARKLPPDKVRAAARGRAWTGNQALALGLVDELGDQETALARTRQAIGLAPDAPVTLTPFPAPKSTLEEVMDLASGKGDLVQGLAVLRQVAALKPWLAALRPIVEATAPGTRFASPPGGLVPGR